MLKDNSVIAEHAARSWVSEQPHIDADRIGVWGTFFGGGLVAYVGTFDSRVKAVVSQVPSLSKWGSRRAMDAGKWDRVGEFLLRDRIARYKTGTVVVESGERRGCVV